MYMPARAYIAGVWRSSSQWRLGAKPLVMGSNESPAEAGGILISDTMNKTETEKINSKKCQMEK